MRRFWLILLAAVVAALLFRPASYAQAGQGSVCVSPVLEDNSDQMKMSFTGDTFCAGEDYRLRFDQHKVFALPTKESVEIDDLDPTVEHKIVVYCGKKQIQTLTLDFSKSKIRQLTLLVFLGKAGLWASPSIYSKCVDAEESTGR